MLSKFILTLALAGSLSACASAVTKEASTGEGSTATTSEAVEPKKVCRYQRTTSSRLGDRVCKYEDQ